MEETLEAWLGELGNELEELEELKELEEVAEGVVVVVEGLWTFLGLSQPILLKPLTGRAWGAGAFADPGGLPLFLLGPYEVLICEFEVTNIYERSLNHFIWAKA